MPTGKSGVMAKYINENNYVSNVDVDCVTVVDTSEAVTRTSTDAANEISIDSNGAAVMTASIDTTKNSQNNLMAF